jgi:hypothetical protein
MHIQKFLQSQKYPQAKGNYNTDNNNSEFF